MAAKQRFSEYEAVILLEGLLDYLDGKLTKIDAMPLSKKSLSKKGFGAL